MDRKPRFQLLVRSFQDLAEGRFSLSLPSFPSQPSQIYSFDPYANLSINQRPQILGGQTLLWSEQSDPSNLDSAVWFAPSLLAPPLRH